MALNVDSMRLYGGAQSPIEIDKETSLFLQRENKLERSPRVDVFQYSNPLKYRSDTVKGTVDEFQFDLERKCALDAPVTYIGTVANKESILMYKDAQNFFDSDVIKGMIEEYPVDLKIKQGFNSTSSVKGVCGENEVDLKIKKLTKGTYLIKGDDFEYKVTDSMLQRPVVVHDKQKQKDVIPVLFAYIKEKIDSQKDDIIISRRAKFAKNR